MVEVLVVLAGFFFCHFVLDSEGFEGFFCGDEDALYGLVDNDFSVFEDVGVFEFDGRVDRFSEEDSVGMEEFGKHGPSACDLKMNIILWNRSILQLLPICSLPV